MCALQLQSLLSLTSLPRFDDDWWATVEWFCFSQMNLPSLDVRDYMCKGFFLLHPPFVVGDLIFGDLELALWCFLTSSAVFSQSSYLGFIVLLHNEEVSAFRHLSEALDLLMLFLKFLLLPCSHCFLAFGVTASEPDEDEILGRQNFGNWCCPLKPGFSACGINCHWVALLI